MIKEVTRRRRNPRRRLSNLLAFGIEASENLLLIGDLGGVVVIDDIELVDAVFVGEDGSGVGVLEEGVFGGEGVVNGGVGGGTAEVVTAMVVGGEAAVKKRD